MNEIPGNSPNARCHLRIARPTADLQLAERFWVGGVGMEVLWRTPDNLDHGHQLLMVGWRAATWHIELVCDKAYAALNSPSEEDLLVVYLAAPIDSVTALRIAECGGVRTASRNPYWDEHGVTFSDPDGYRLVLTTRAWGAQASS